MSDASMIIDILKQLLEALEKVRWRFSPVRSVSDLTETPEGMEKLDSICMLLVAIGEGCKKIDRLTDGKFLAKYPEIDWKGVKGLRDIISHHYFDIDAEEIFNICSERLLPLIDSVQQMIRDLEQD